MLVALWVEHKANVAVVLQWPRIRFQLFCHNGLTFIVVFILKTCNSEKIGIGIGN